MNVEGLYPALLIPKKCTTLQSECELTDNVFIDLTITSRDTEGNDMCIYSGFCNVKLIDSYNVDYQRYSPSNSGSIELIDTDNIPLNVNEINQTYPFQCPSQNQVWIDPSRSPYVYNQYDGSEGQEQYSVYHQTQSNRITVEQHNTTFITQNVYNYNDLGLSGGNEFEHKKFRKVQVKESTNQTSDINFNLYEEDEFECGVFLSQLPTEIMHEKETKAREERRFMELRSDNDALKQLMSTGIQSVSKQQKTILFLGHDSNNGQTIQQIAVNDPGFKCAPAIEYRKPIPESIKEPTSHKKYQCDNCKQIFDQTTEFRQHIVGSHKASSKLTKKKTGSWYVCQECGKKIKNKEKFELHCLGHGDPDLECSKCHKVFASKFTLRTHSKIHSKKYKCSYCPQQFLNSNSLRSHKAKNHFSHFSCEICGVETEKYEEFLQHRESHDELNPDSSESEITESVVEDTIDSDMITLSPPDDVKATYSEVVVVDYESTLDKDFDENTNDLELSREINNNEIESVIDDNKSSLDEVNEGLIVDVSEKIMNADSVIAKVMSNEIFLMNANKRQRKYNKVCVVCRKMFDRIGDLKRHLIEHVIKSTLAKTPVSKDGTLKIQCEVCQVDSFTRIDRYKAHLRAHAKLTLYKCIFCDKSFSDSSNFSKHKKIHGSTYLQCDLCQRKFNSKKMITQHMEYHNRNTPLPCKHCDKVFYFQSMFNKHMKLAHLKTPAPKFKCQFCDNYLKSLKEKWDHEWSVHNVRKMIADCSFCHSKFRKYSELKRHCISVHNKEIPPAKKVLKKYQ